MEAVVFSVRSSIWRRDALLVVLTGSFGAILVAMSLHLGVINVDFPRELAPSLTWLPAAQVVVTVVLFLTVLVGVVVQIRLAAPERNFLRIDQTGLTFARNGQSRTWAWPELSPFERDTFSRIKFFLPNLDPEQARRDRWLHEMTLKGAMFVIPDLYDTQLDKLIAQLNAFRAKALGERSDAGGAVAARPSPAAAMPPVTFGEKPWRKWLTLATCLPLSLFCWVVTVVFAKDLLAAAGSSGSPAPWLQFLVAIFAFTGAVFATATPVVTLLFGRSLRLDDAGLTYTHRLTSGRGSENRHWYWSELSAFEYDDTGAPTIRFCLRKLDPEQARRDRWVQEVTPEGALVVVRDIYDAPLDEIAAKLNEYRARVLGSAPGHA